METLQGTRHNSSYSDFDVINKQQGEKIEKTLIINTDLYDGDLKWFAPQIQNNSMMIDVIEKMAQAVYELHRKNIVHQDIKPQNFLIKTNSQGLKLALTDYGLSKYHSDKTFSKHLCGTRGYIDPQVCLLKIKSNISYKNTEDAIAADIFSLGMSLYKLFYNSKNDLPEITKNINHDALPGKNHTRGSLEDITKKFEKFSAKHKELKEIYDTKEIISFKIKKN